MNEKIADDAVDVISAGKAGMTRLIDYDTAELAADRRLVVFVRSIEKPFRWRRDCQLPPDNIMIVNPLPNGLKPGRFVMELEWLDRDRLPVARGADLHIEPEEVVG